MLLEYLKSNYNIDEPIFIADIDLSVTPNNLRQMFKVLCDKGELKRYDTGIYYLQGPTRLKGGTTISASKVAKYKYISRLNQIDGYYSGYTFANQLGLTTQVPVTIEIVTNRTSATYREVTIQNQKIILRKPRTQITRENSSVLQLLDLLKDMERYVDDDMTQATERITQYIKDTGISIADVDQYIGSYPTQIYKTIYEMRLYDVFTRG